MSMECLRFSRKGILPLTLAGLIILANCGMLAFMAHVAWPGFHPDADAYLSPVINKNNRHIHEFSIIPRHWIGSGKTDWRFDFHGQLYQSFMCRLTPSPMTTLNLIHAVGTLNILSVLLNALHVFLRLRQGGSSREVAAGYAALLTLGLSSALLYLQGRPEHLLPLVLAAVGIPKTFLRDPRGIWAAHGVETCLVGLTSPLAGILLGCVRMVQAGETRHFSQTLKRALIMGATTTLLGLLVMNLIYPFSILDWILNMRLHGGATRYQGRWLAICDAFNPMAGATFVLALACLGFRALLIGDLRGRLPGRLWSAGFLAILALITYRATLHWPMPYNYVGFYVGAALFTLTSFETLRGDPWRKPQFSNVGRILVAALGLAVCVHTGRQILLLRWHLRHGMRYERAVALVNEIKTRMDPREFIVFSRIWNPPSFFVVETSGLRSIAVRLDSPEEFHACLAELKSSPPPFVLLPQISDKPAPKDFFGYRLLNDHWIYETPTFAGRKCQGWMPGYQFAVYYRADLLLTPASPDAPPPP